uniref:Uncharacterized protein n=1 Tax=Cyprinus carpio carpio TaxID=630221 RepID=A0A9J7XRZ5_CYPCA
MVLSMCIIYYGKAVCSEASVQIMSRLDSLQFSVLTKHSSRRAGRAMIIISFLTSWHTNILITVFSMYLTKKMEKKERKKKKKRMNGTVQNIPVPYQL